MNLCKEPNMYVCAFIQMAFVSSVTQVSRQRLLLVHISVMRRTKIVFLIFINKLEYVFDGCCKKKINFRVSNIQTLNLIFSIFDFLFPLSTIHRKSLGYDCLKTQNLIQIDSNILAFASGNFVHFFDVITKKITSRRSIDNTGISCLTVITYMKMIVCLNFEWKLL